MTEQKRDQIFVAIDEVAANLRGALDAGSRAVKTFLTLYFDSLETKANGQNGAVSSTPDDRLMTADEVAEYLRLKPQTIYVWASDHKIPHRKVNGKPRFLRSEIDAWIMSNGEKI